MKPELTPDIKRAQASLAKHIAARPDNSDMHALGIWVRQKDRLQTALDHLNSQATNTWRPCEVPAHYLEVKNG